MNHTARYEHLDNGKRRAVCACGDWISRQWPTVTEAEADWRDHLRQAMAREARRLSIPTPAAGPPPPQQVSQTEPPTRQAPSPPAEPEPAQAADPWADVSPPVQQLLRAHLTPDTLARIHAGRLTVPAALDAALAALGGRHSTSQCTQCTKEAPAP